MRFQYYRKCSNSAPRNLYLILPCILVSLVLTACKTSTPIVNDIPISINSDQFYFSNVQQDCTSTQMQAFAGSLYIYLPVSDDHSEHSVYEFNQYGVSKLENILIIERYRQLWNDRVAGFCNGYMYIIRHPAKDHESAYPKKAELLCYNLKTGTSETLVSTEEAAYMSIELDENGYLFVSTKEISTSTEKQYETIHKNILFPDKVSQPNDVRTGSTSEVLCKYNSISSMLSDDQLNNAGIALTELGLENHGCVLYPFEGGWLLHMSNCKIPLCLISADGSVTPIMEYECLSSSSSFNYYGDYAFLSLMRYEKWDDNWSYFLEPYENDTISGTYRIDLNDCTITKINDNYFNGIFIFDEASIFVCDTNDGVYQMDQDGNLIMTLVEPDQ